MSEQEIPRQRVRIHYERGEALKFISHQDEFRMWERTLRRADLPLLYKQGFNPQPNLVFASPLSVGFTGVREPLDIIFSPPLPLDELVQRIQAKLPPGVIVHNIEEVALTRDALMSTLIGADYSIVIYAEPGEIDQALLRGRIDQFLAQSEVWSERQRKGEYYTYNLRPLVYELRYVGYELGREEHTIFVRVQQVAGATGRPDEVVSALALDDYARTLRRERIYFGEEAADAQLFAHYRRVTQAELSPAHAPKPSGKGRFVQDEGERLSDAGSGVNGSGINRQGINGRGISERAADEFV